MKRLPPAIRSIVSKRMGIFLSLPALVSLGFSAMSFVIPAAAHSSSPDAVRDTLSDTWAATDALGRRVATACPSESGPENPNALPESPGEAPAPREDRFIGMFYFLWLGRHGQQGPFDVTKILAENPNAMSERDNPAWGPINAYHHWGEPLFGYYVSEDRWVLRKHAQMLSDAGVDTLVFDCSNGFTYKESYMPLLETFAAVRRDGGRTPQVAFLCPFSNWNNISARTVQTLFKDLYGPGHFPDLWFSWDDKPLLMAHTDELPPEILDFFTFRKPEPSYFVGPYEPNVWSWLQIYPQHLFFNDRGGKEQMAVGVGQNAKGCNRLAAMSESDTRGRSWHAGRKDPDPEAVHRGPNFAEQFRHAIAVDPKFIFVTGWNEWVAMRMTEFNSVGAPVVFVDQYSQEYGRDIEPMKGGHTDNYYYQLVDFARRYKGARAPQPAGPPRVIRIDGRFDDWREAAPVYLDDLGDTLHRDNPGWGGAGPYRDATGRNDFARLLVARDDENLYFYAQTREPITTPDENDSDWMVLLLDSDRDAATGRMGYDYAINRSRPDATSALIERWDPAAGTRGQGEWVAAGRAEFRVAGAELELSVARSILAPHTDADPLNLEFKWIDNMGGLDDPMKFLLHGDTAPNARFNYVYRCEPSANTTSSPTP